jgi:N-acetyl-gamma-glutamyl-phosphate reductase
MGSKIKVGIIGGAGYTGGELLRLLIHHPDTEISFVASRTHAGKALADIHTDLLGDTELTFLNAGTKPTDVIFLCVGHGEAQKYLESNPPSPQTRVIDLSQDHRIKNTSSVKPGWIYGLPELNRSEISKAHRVANPGCFATCIQLGLLPLAQNNLLNKDIHINATTGSTGAGQSLSPTSHFTWRQNNLSIYKAFTHQHLAEIGQSLHQLQPDLDVKMHFIPQRGAFTRGILAGIYTSVKEDLETLIGSYKTFYANHPFVHVSKEPVDLKQIVNTNKCFLHLEKQENELLITSVIDNLLKGASGQALQNMNLMFGLEETAGLKLKASAF